MNGWWFLILCAIRNDAIRAVLKKFVETESSEQSEAFGESAQCVAWNWFENLDILA